MDVMILIPLVQTVLWTLVFFVCLILYVANKGTKLTVVTSLIVANIWTATFVLTKL